MYNLRQHRQWKMITVASIVGEGMGEIGKAVVLRCNLCK